VFDEKANDDFTISKITILSKYKATSEKLHKIIIYICKINFLNYFNQLNYAAS